MDLDQVEARQVYPLVDLALAQRAVWMNDVSMAVFGGKQAAQRVKDLTAAMVPEPEKLSDLEALKKLAKAVAPKRAEEMEKHLDFVAYCRKRGITW